MPQPTQPTDARPDRPMRPALPGHLTGSGPPAAAGLVAAAVVAAAAVGYAYHLAQAGQRSGAFAWFWVGTLTAFAAAAVVATGRDRPAAVRVAALAVLGGWGALPKLFRSQGAPVFSDEFAHLAVIRDLTVAGRIDPDTALVAMAPEYPGLHLLVDGFAAATGIGGFWAATVLVLAAHASAPVAVSMLATRAGCTASSAAVAGLVYATNPSWLLFDAQVAYESLAVPLLLWALAATAATRRRSTVAAVVLVVAVAVTHHLTGFAAAAVLTGWAAVAGWRERRGPLPAVVEHPARVGVVAAAAAVAAAGWAASRWEQLGEYLAPSVTSPLDRLVETVAGDGDTSARVPFGGSSLPWFEQVAGWLVPVVVAAGAVAATVTLGERWRRVPSLVWVAGLLTVGYVASLGWLVTVAGSEGARRTWAVTYAGIAVLFAAGLSAAAETRRGRRRRVPWWVRPVGAAAGLVLVVGGVAAGQNETYRFGGPFEIGNDARSLSAEGDRVAAFVASVALDGDRVLADRYVRGPVALAGPADPVAPGDVHELSAVTLDPAPVDAATAAAWAHVDWVVVDRRMFSEVPAMGFWYTTGEPRRTVPVPGSVAKRLECLDWLTLVFATGSYQVFAVSGTPTPGGCRP